MVVTKKTFCRICHAACPMEIDVENGDTIVAVRGDRSDPLFEGYTCIKGRQLADQWHDPGRLRGPLRKRAWEAGWNNFTDADVSLAIGYNSIVSSYAAGGGLQGTNPVVKLRQAKERGLKLIVIDPRKSEFATQVDIWLQVTPGEDPTLLADMVNLILERKLHEHEVPAAPINELTDVFVDPQVVHNQSIHEWEHPLTGTTRSAKPPARFSHTVADPPWRADSLGQSTGAVLAGLGYTPDELAGLAEQGVIYENGSE